MESGSGMIGIKIQALGALAVEVALGTLLRNKKNS